MKVPLPKGEYIKNIEIQEDGIDISFAPRKKIALCFISINERYWPYLKQVIEDCRQHFLPHHNVDYYVWTDIPQEDTLEYTKRLESLLPEQAFQYAIQNNMRQPDQWWSRDVIKGTVDFLRNQKDIHLVETEPVDWPAPTLMRFHLFLNKEEELKDYDYVFYLDADMRVVDKISDEVLGESLTTAPHPGYFLDKRYYPPLEPNKDSTAYIERLGYISTEEGKPRFIPFYAAGGFQGGKSQDFLEAMKVMKKNIDKDFDNNNYVAIWNDESHWNKYLWDYQKSGGKITFLDPSYVYPDSLINEYYIPLWGKDYKPKIITLTKPFSLSKQAGAELAQMTGARSAVANCPTCGDTLPAPAGQTIRRVLQCGGKGGAHQVETQQ